MALLPSGMGWSAEENFMKQYAGTIGNINKVGGLYNAPVISSDGDITHGLMYAETVDRYYYCAVSNSRMQVALRKANTTSTGVQLWGLSFDSSDLLYTGYVVKSTGVASGGHQAANNTPSGTGWAPGIHIAYGSPSSLSIANIIYNAIPIMLNNEIKEAAYKISSDIDKVNDGYTAIAWVKYKTGSTSVSETPVLISSVDSYTFFSGFHNETFTALYNGKRFYFSFAYGIGGGSPFGIQTLDYTGAEYPAMSPALLFEYVARSVSLTVTEAGDPWGDTPSEEGGGDGGDDTGDGVPFSTPPVASAVNSGFITLFTPDLLTIQGVASYMWNTLDVDLFKKIMGNPIDAIIGLHIVPCGTIPAGQKEIKVGGVGTGQTSGYTTTQYVQVNCGTVTVPKKWGSYLDYSPYTKVEIWLPYIGFREIDIDDVQGKTLGLNYWIDILSGACNAELYVPCDDGNSAVLYSWAGHCANEIPITSADMRGAVSAAMAIAGSAVAAVAGVASGGATAPMAAGLIASATVNSTALKPSIQRSGSASGSAGFLAQQTPYIIRSQPNIALPAEQYKFTGYPSFVTVALNTISGYNEVDSIHLEGIPATGAEIDEIENLLKGGVIF